VAYKRISPLVSGEKPPEAREITGSQWEGYRWLGKCECVEDRLGARYNYPGFRERV
jgi:hypothetical protein